MRFKTSLSREGNHTNVVTCVGWGNTEEVYSCSDDHTILKWNLLTQETVKVASLPQNLFPTDLHWFPRGSKKQGSDLMLITSSDGKYHLINKSGRLEKTVEAHRGAILSGRWSYDGAGLLTAGEDGQVKIWSKSGMLRSTILQSGTPVYSATWAPDSNHVLYTFGKMLVIKPLAANSKSLKWKAHEGLILKVAWCPCNNHIISGGEDCRYKVWDTYGRQLYVSRSHDYPITSLAWSPSGELFAVGSHNTLRLCDKRGWSYSLEKPDTGSIFSLAWSNDGTQVAGACGNSHVIFAHVIERRLEWKQYEATVSGRKRISVRNVANETVESLEFSDRVIKVGLDFGHLVVITPTHGHIYSVNNWNTAVLFDLREGSVCMLRLALRFFLLVEKSSVALYTYDGKLLCSPRWPTMQPDTLNESTVSIGPDSLAIRDEVDDKMVHLFDVAVGRNLAELPAVNHSLGVVEVALSQSGLPVERQLVLLDRNRDLYIVNVRDPRRHIRKIGAMILSLCWNTDNNMLACFQDTNLTVSYYPNALFADKDLLRRSEMMKDARIWYLKKQNPYKIAHVSVMDGVFLEMNYIRNLKFGMEKKCSIPDGLMAEKVLQGVENLEFEISMNLPGLRSLESKKLVFGNCEYGKNPVIVSFVGNHLYIRREDGSLVNCIISAFQSVLQRYTCVNNWKDALKLCRYVKDETLWACLAAMAAHAKDLDTAQEAYAAINEADKVELIKSVQRTPLRTTQLAEMLLLGGNVQDAESIFLQNGQVFRAIMMNLQFHDWIRSIDLATKHRTHIDTVLFYRKIFLSTFEKVETSEKYLKVCEEVEVDEKKVKVKMDSESTREREKAGFF